MPSAADTKAYVDSKGTNDTQLAPMEHSPSDMCYRASPDAEES